MLSAVTFAAKKVMPFEIDRDKARWPNFRNERERWSHNFIWTTIAIMVSRHRYSQQPTTPTKDEEHQLLSSYDDGSSKIKPHRLLRQGATITLSQAILFAAVSASLAAVLTAFGASHYLMGGFDHSVVTMSSHTMQSTYSRRITAEYEKAPSTAEKSKFLSSFGAMSDSMVDEDTTSLFAGRIQEPEFLRADADEVDDGQLKVVWLMSFPNRYVTI